MLQKFKQLKTGQKRLVFVLSFLFALLIQYITEPRDFLDFQDEDFWLPLIIGWIVYWVLVMIVLWVIDGFKKQNNE